MFVLFCFVLFCFVLFCLFVCLFVCFFLVLHDYYDINRVNIIFFVFVGL